jgi:hypothetical protein
MFILIHSVNFGVTIASPEDSGIEGPADDLSLCFQEELMENHGCIKKRRHCDTEIGFHHLLFK